MAETLTPEQLADLVATQGNQIKELISGYNELKDANVALKKQLAEHTNDPLKTEEPKKLIIPDEPVVAGNKKYKIKSAKIVIPGANPLSVTAEELLLDNKLGDNGKKLVERILEIEGQGILKETV